MLHGKSEELGVNEVQLVSEAAPSAISVHSWVSFGHVGHGMAHFVLMRMGVRTTMVPCVVYSSSLTYKDVGGAPLEGEFIQGLCDAITKQPEFAHNSAVWSGFLGTPSAARSTIGMLKELIAKKGEKVRYICDPVLGDRGALYLPPEMVAVYTDELLYQADIILPNRYEIGWLLGKDEPKSIEEAKSYCNELLNKYSNLEAVVATGVVDARDENSLFIVLVEREKSPVVVSVAHYSDRHFAGAGDLFSGVVTAELLHGADYREALLSAAGRTSAIIKATSCSGHYEMRLVENQFILDRNVDVSGFYEVIEE